MIQLNTNSMNIKNTDGAWEPVVATGVIIDSVVDTGSNNAVSGNAVAMALEEKVDKTSIATNAEIDELFEETEGV